MPRTYDPEALVAGALAGERASVARLISMVEKGGESAHAAIARLYPHTGSAYTVGITGAPGAGKSTLTDKLISRIRKEDLEVGVLAIDPSSPFSGGAILGDRVRMQDHATDPGVFIRSMATRGHLGGLSLATPQAVRVLDAAGKPWVLIETVGVGQVEIEVAGAADTTMVVVNPGWGDAVQAAKAGLLEIADLFVVNKADRAGSAETVRDLEFMLDLSMPPKGETHWRPPIVKTVASRGEGLDELWEAIGSHRAFLETDGRLAARRTKRIRDELRAIVVERLYERAGTVCTGPRFDELAAAVEAREIDPYTAADSLLSETLS
ncbi:MAG TPA: methylmalonyl Co-A mutase-associated GTPase MeaB [Acidimicrobiia bacterium]|nr:methylmalonyl Co-A mutase-associated GTPase MeaB [Acidimicrobiia bacterium]